MSSFLGMFYFTVEEIGTGVTLNQLNFKSSCKAASTINILLNSPVSFVINDVIINEGDRLLVKDQTLSRENGIYKRVGNEFVRTSDCDTWEDLVMAFVLVESGSSWKGTIWFLYVEQGGTIEINDIDVEMVAVSKDMIFSSNFVRDGLSQREIDLSDSVSPGIYGQVTVDIKGRVTAGGATVFTTTTDVEVTEATRGLILKSLDDSRFRITIDNGGVLMVEKL